MTPSSKMPWQACEVSVCLVEQCAAGEHIVAAQIRDLLISLSFFETRPRVSVSAV
jgi:hypothetical protein